MKFTLVMKAAEVICNDKQHSFKATSPSANAAADSMNGSAEDRSL
jgi:hypothetical protein